MYAIIQTGSKQFHVEEGDEIEVELLEGEGRVEFKEVLFLRDDRGVQLGMPFLSSCSVKGEILGETKGPKVVSFVYRRRKDSKRRLGHRQKYTRVKILEIVSTQEGKDVT